jgi:hypothetical protein
MSEKVLSVLQQFVRLEVSGHIELGEYQEPFLHMEIQGRQHSAPIDSFIESLSKLPFNHGNLDDIEKVIAAVNE